MIDENRRIKYRFVFRFRTIPDGTPLATNEGTDSRPKTAFTVYESTRLNLNVTLHTLVCVRKLRSGNLPETLETSLHGGRRN